MIRKSRQVRRSVMGVGTVLVTAALALTGCSGSPGSDDPGTEPGDVQLTKVNVVLPFPPDVTYSPVYVGQEAGFFADEGLDITFDVAGGSGKVVQQVLAGNVDFGVASSGAVLAGAAKSPELRVFSCHTPGNVYRISTMNPEVKKMADLKGKVIGITDQAGGEIPMIKASLTSAGLTEADVTLLVVGEATPAVLQALQNGTIDAFATGFQAIESLRAAGADLRDIMPTDVAVTPSSCMIALDTTLADPDKQKIAVGIARGWDSSLLFGVENHQAAIDITCKLAPSTCVNKDLVEKLFVEGIKVTTSDQADYPYGYVSEKGWTKAAEMFKAAGTLSGDPDVATLTSDSVVTQIQKEANTYDRDAVVKRAKEWK